MLDGKVWNERKSRDEGLKLKIQFFARIAGVLKTMDKASSVEGQI
jgi:hypothetical protein